MAGAVEKRYFTFVKGLNTEAGYLTFPENSWKGGDNMIPAIDGSIKRRTGLDAEDGYTLSSATSSSYTANASQEALGAYTLNEWNNVGGDGNVNFTVVQSGATLLFYNNISAEQSASYVGQLTLTNALGNTNAAGTSPISVFSSNGKLLVVSADTEPLLLSYSSGTISSSTVTISIRDLSGVNDGLAVDNRPATLSTLHQYNLLNQGWTDLARINTYQSVTGVYPSNTQVWHAGKNSSGDFAPTVLNNIEFGTSPAAKGRYVISAFNRDRNTVSGLTGITVETETYRPATVSFWAGRAWYSGVKSSSIGNWVFYSQVATSDANYGKCYQDADPTSEDVSDLVASDGGIIPIQECGTILKLIPYSNSMLVVADNGVWQIKTGVDDVFSATSYSVIRISNVGCLAARSVVETEQGILYWGVNGIFLIKRTDTGAYVVESITANTIQSLYNDIEDGNKPYATGVYYQRDKIVYWLYSDTARTGMEHRYKADKLLCLDIRLGSFYTMSITSLSSNSPYVFDMIVSKSKASSNIVYDVADSSSNTLLDSFSNSVVATVGSETYAQTVVKFGTVWPNGSTFDVTFSQFKDRTSDSRFRDWYAKDNVGGSFVPYILTGYDFASNQTGASKDIQPIYITVFCKRTEQGFDDSGLPINDSSCLLQARWDWTDSTVAGKWGSSNEVYRHNRVFLGTPSSSTYEDGTPLVVTKNKVRGLGKTLQLYYTTTGDKDMHIVGWAIPYLVNTST